MMSHLEDTLYPNLTDQSLVQEGIGTLWVKDLRGPSFRQKEVCVIILVENSGPAEAAEQGPAWGGPGPDREVMGSHRPGCRNIILQREFCRL